MPLQIRPEDLYVCPVCLAQGIHPKDEDGDLAPFYQVCPTHGRPTSAVEVVAATTKRDVDAQRRVQVADQMEATVRRAVASHGPVLVMLLEAIQRCPDAPNWIDMYDALERARQNDRRASTVTVGTSGAVTYAGNLLPAVVAPTPTIEADDAGDVDEDFGAPVPAGAAAEPPIVRRRGPNKGPRASRAKRSA